MSRKHLPRYCNEFSFRCDGDRISLVTPFWTNEDRMTHPTEWGVDRSTAERLLAELTAALGDAPNRCAFLNTFYPDGQCTSRATYDGFCELHAGLAAPREVKPRGLPSVEETKVKKEEE